MKTLLTRIAILLFVSHVAGVMTCTAVAGTPTRAASVAPGNAPSSITRQPLVSAVTPTLRPDGKKWRLGYLGSGEHTEYPRTLRAIVQGLAQLGWLSTPELPADLSSEQLWAFLAEHTTSAYLEFVHDAWWQPGHFDAEQRPKVRDAVMARLSTLSDIDLIIAMGTWAGQDMVTLDAPVPTIVAAASDAVSAHIVESPADSGLDNLLARVQPEHHQQQVRLFHDIVPFKRLGLVYENTPEGKTYGAVDAAQQVARERGFDVIACHARSTGLTREQASKNVLDCYRRLAPDIDAAYVTLHIGTADTTTGHIAQILRQAHIPSFAMLGSEYVEQGILLSLAQADYAYVGLFYAKSIARIFNGAQARQLNQIWMDPQKLAINLYTARLIGFDPPVDVLLAADEVFENN
ncbi:ABC transporter substrate binding protein [Bordetella tumulicola]